MTYFLDTNVIIDLLNGHSSVLATFKNTYTFESVRIPDLKVFSIGTADNKKSSAQIKQREESTIPHLFFIINIYGIYSRV